MRLRNVLLVVVVVVASVCDVILFSPALFSGKILALGDGLDESVPAFLAPFRLWNAAMLLGYPVYADGSLAQFYPLRLLRFIPSGFNLYMIAPYAICGAALFGYVFDVTEKRIAAATSGCAFACGGFTMAHVGHPMIVHPAAWATVNLWALQRFFSTRQTLWLAPAAVSLALAFASGQPQIGLFAVVLAGAYVVVLEGPRAVSERSAAGLAFALASVALGGGLAAVCLIPAAALGRESTRLALSFSAFTAFSLPLDRLAMMVFFPLATGGGASSIFAGPFLATQPGAFAETTLYVPAAAVVLAVCGALSRPRPIALFWSAVVIVGVALAAGPALPFARWTYAIYPFDLFRIPGRHAFEITLGLAILAGLGVASLETLPKASKAALAGGLFAAAALGAAALRDVAVRDATLLRQPYVTWFLALDVFQAVLLVAALAAPLAARTRVAAAAVAVLSGAALFGALGYWRDAPPATVLAAPRAVTLLRELPLGPGQRVYTYSNEPSARLKPNLPWIWNVPDLAGYTPLQLRDVRRFLGADQGDGKLLDPGTSAVDFAAVRYLAVAAQPVFTSTDALPFGPAELGIFLSGTSDLAPRSLALGFQNAVRADRIVMVSALGASVQVTQGTRVGSLVVHHTNGAETVLPLRAGVDTAELAYDRPDIAGTARHARAPVFTTDVGTTWYRMSRRFRTGSPVRSIELRVAMATNALNVRKISLVDDATHRAVALSEESVFFADTAHFRHITDVDGIAVFENLRARPEHWIESGTGRVTDAGSARDANDFTVDCVTECVAVSSDVWSADWFTTVDGAAVPLLRRHSVLRATVVPPGSHRVRAFYRPRALIAGALVSALCFATLALGCALTLIRSHRAVREPS